MRWLIAGVHSLNSVLQVSAAHLARGLAGWKSDDAAVPDAALYLPAPISPAHFLLKRRDPRFVERRPYWGLAPTRHSAYLSEYTPLSLLPALNQRPFSGDASLRRSLEWTVPRLRRALRNAGFSRPDALVINNLQYAWLDRLVQPRLLIYRCVDDIRGFANAPANLARAEEALLRRCDMCVASSRDLAAKLVSRGARNPLVITHGVNFASHSAARSSPEPEELKSIPRPRAVFVGSMNERLHAELLREAAKRLPRLSFVLIGPNAGWRFDQANIHCLGSRPASDIPSYLGHCDVGLIPFRRSALVDSTYPVKLLEYLASGLPVVATRWPELQALSAPIRLVDDADSFVAALEAALGDRDSAGRLEYARARSWTDKIAVFRGEAVAALSAREGTSGGQAGESSDTGSSHSASGT
jgi:glycosyltransferase involved in cell wall biosynthesis